MDCCSDDERTPAAGLAVEGKRLGGKGNCSAAPASKRPCHAAWGAAAAQLQAATVQDGQDSNRSHVDLPSSGGHVNSLVVHPDREAPMHQASRTLQSYTHSYPVDEDEWSW